MVFIVSIFGVTYRQKQTTATKGQKAVVVVGLPKNQTGLVNEIQKAFKDAAYLDRGDQLLKDGKIDEAIEQYNIALSVAKLSGEKGVTLIHIANAYEKKRNYKKALENMIIVRDSYVNEWAKEPIAERVKYLEYASNGDYELAVKHAENALEADAKLPNRPKEGRSDYIERLNNIKVSKSYISSLKKNNP